MDPGSPHRTESPTRAPWLIRAVGSFGLAAFTGAAVASDPWSRADVERQIAWSTFQTIDWLQTRYIATHPEQFNEINPLLGRHPGLGSVNWIFIPITLATPLVVDQLPSRWRPWLQWPGLVFEGTVVGRNAAIGIRLEF